MLTLAGFGCCRQELGGGSSGRSSSGGGSSGSWEEVVTVATAASGTMARLVAVCRDGEEEFPFERRQIPLYIDDTLTVSGLGRVGPAAPLAAVSLLPLPQAECCALEKECVATPRRGRLSDRPHKLAFAVAPLVLLAGPKSSPERTWRSSSQVFLPFRTLGLYVFLSDAALPKHAPGRRIEGAGAFRAYPLQKPLTLREA